MSTTLYIVATPIGNLKDITLRAIETLKFCQIIACEDTRVTKKLLNHYGIQNKKIYSIHQHNEKATALKIIEEATSEGEAIAYVTDAGTPCISDPGMFLVNQARTFNIKIEPIPGPSAITSAFSVSGIDDGRFNFIGFLPTKLNAIEETLHLINQQQKPTIFYESPKRVLSFLEIIVIPSKIKEKSISNEEIALLKVLMKELPLKKAAAIVSEFYNGNKKKIYNIGIGLKNE